MREKILNSIGFALLGICFVVSLTRIMTTQRSTGEGEANQVVIRFAHWQLENGVRGTFDKIAAEYMKLHPKVKVEQLPIPESIYTNWLVTQLVGETAPDLIQIGIGTTDERTARFFLPLTDLATHPNPYNMGTDLEGVPLRNTLFDGMEAGYVASLLEYYGVPISGASVRMFYNLDLLKQISGSEELPKTYEELVHLADQAQAYAQKKGMPLVAIAGSKYNAPLIMQRLFSSQTQKLAERLNPPGAFNEDFTRRADDYLENRWSLDNEEVRSGFDLMHEVGKYMQPGFIQLQRDDATLSFVQSNALMISTGSWDATSIRQQITFRIGVSTVPFPSTENGVYGKYTLGNLSEAGANGGVIFGITRSSQHPEIAKDFLQFLASRQMNQLWTDESGWIPATLGTRVSPDVAPFLPVTTGYLSGFSPTLAEGGTFPDVNRLVGTNLHRLLGPTGDTTAFVDSIKPGYHDALINDLRRYLRTTSDISQRGDTQFGGLAWLAREQPKDSSEAARLDAFMQSASLNDRKFYRVKLSLQKAEVQ